LQDIDYQSLCIGKESMVFAALHEERHADDEDPFPATSQQMHDFVKKSHGVFMEKSHGVSVEKSHGVLWLGETGERDATERGDEAWRQA
jgi:hypothetical protein